MAKQGFYDQHWTKPGLVLSSSEVKVPDGGVSTGRGFTISWQHGPVVDEDGTRSEPNGAFVEDVMAACKQRIEHYQTVSDGRFACRENALAIENLQQALDACAERTGRRQERGVEGTHDES